jgi:ATP/maltotriose-dependent transcriptional regulator MalT
MEECIHLSELAGFIVPQVFTRADLAVVYAGLGAIGRGLETANLALTMAQTQFPLVRVYVLAVLAHIHVLNGNLLEAESAINQGKDDPNREAVPTFFVPVRLSESELALRQGDNERALTVADDLLGDLHQFGMRVYLPQVLYLQGQALLGLGQADAARNLWLKALTEAQAIGSRRMLWQILAALSQLETDPAEVECLRRQAREIVEYIANHIGTPELRASFLGLPQVKAVRSA